MQNRVLPDFLVRHFVHNKMKMLRKRQITMEDYLFPTIFIVIITALAVLVELIRTIFEI